MLDKSSGYAYTDVWLCCMAWLFFDNMQNGVLERWSVGLRPESRWGKRFQSGLFVRTFKSTLRGRSLLRVTDPCAGIHGGSLPFEN
jgi:hypothetical protein